MICKCGGRSWEHNEDHEFAPNPGTHCKVCEKPVSEPSPGADVYHMPCLMDAMRYLREKT